MHLRPHNTTRRNLSYHSAQRLNRRGLTVHQLKSLAIMYTYSDFNVRIT